MIVLDAVSRQFEPCLTTGCVCHGCAPVVWPGILFPNSRGNHLEPWYTWIQVWFHDILHIHEFIYEFIGHEMSHMNSWSWNLIWIHNMNSDMNSWSWRISWNHMSEFICMNSFLNSCWWIHDNEIMYEFIIMNSCVNSVLWRISWNHTWIHKSEFLYDFIGEFVEQNSTLN